MLTRDLPLPTERTGDSRKIASRKINQPVADRVDNQLGGLVDSQSVHHVGTVDGDGVRAKVEGGRNLLVGLAIHDHLQHFEFAWGKRGVALAFEWSRALELGIEYSFAVRDSPDGSAQLQVHSIFQDVAARASLECLPHQSLLRMHTEHEHQRLRMLGKNLTRGFQPVHPGHGAIHDNHFRTKLLRKFDRLKAIASFAGNSDVRLNLQNAAESSA